MGVINMPTSLGIQIKQNVLAAFAVGLHVSLSVH
jgi:hypothetical protein